MRWTAFFRRRHWDRERALELTAYLEQETADNVARGMAEDEARDAARRKLGNTTLVREELYLGNSIPALDSLGRNLRYTVRQLRPSEPGLRPGRGAVAGAGHRGHDRDLHPHRPDPAPAAPASGFAARAAGTAQLRASPRVLQYRLRDPVVSSLCRHPGRQSGADGVRPLPALPERERPRPDRAGGR